MKKIKRLVKLIDDEIEGAECYAERYLESKADGDSEMASRYHDMANDELKHMGYLHDYTVKEIEKISKVFQPPSDMINKWDEEHEKYLDKVDYIKSMLNA